MDREREKREREREREKERESEIGCNTNGRRVRAMRQLHLVSSGRQVSDYNYNCIM
jgi:hypothetical protein